MKTYVTFGKKHIHKVNGKILDKDCIAVIEGALGDVLRMFKGKYEYSCDENLWNPQYTASFPRGFIEI